MKKVSLILILFMNICFSQNNISEEFFKSDVSKKILSNVNKYGALTDITEIKGKFEGVDVSIISYNIKNEGKIVGFFQFSKAHDDNFLTQIVLFDKNFDFAGNTGEINFVDSTSNNTIVRYTLDKGIVVKIDGVEVHSKPPRRKKCHILDLDCNGDITFSECYKAVNDAIESDGFSMWTCDIPFAGALSCWTSVTIACQIFSLYN